MTGPTARCRRFRLTPDRVVVALQALEGCLWLPLGYHGEDGGWVPMTV
jgi:hypothetical protein